MIMKVQVTRKHVKNLTIKIADDQNVFVVAPVNMSVEVIKGFLDKKSAWISSKIEQKQQVKQNNIDLFLKRAVLINGREYKVVSGNVPNICTVDGKIIVPQQKCIDDVVLGKELAKYMLSIAKSVLPKYVAAWGTKMSLCPTAINVKNLKSKWGSCNGNGEIVLNAKLIQVPENIIHYVVVHELCHLKNLNHSKAFWDSVKYYLPEYLNLRKKLSEYDFLITL